MTLTPPSPLSHSAPLSILLTPSSPPSHPAPPFASSSPLLPVNKQIARFLQIDPPLQRIPPDPPPIHRHRHLLQFPAPLPHSPAERQLAFPVVRHHQPAILIP